MQESKLTFQAFHQWRRRAVLSSEVERQARLCGTFLRAVEMNLPEPDPSMIGGAVAELHKLERMLAFPTI